MLRIGPVYLANSEIESLSVLLDQRIICAVGVNKTMHLEFTTHVRPDYSPLLGVIVILAS